MAASICKARILRFLFMLLRRRRKPYVTAFLQPSSHIVKRIRLFYRSSMSSLQHLQGHPTENFEKKAYIKNKTAILAFWEIAGKSICSSLPASLMDEFPASKVHLQPIRNWAWSKGEIHPFQGERGWGDV